MMSKEGMVMKLNFGPSDQSRKGVIDVLNVLLADEYILCTTTRNYHWNVVGLQLHDLHKFFESQYDELDDVVNEARRMLKMAVQQGRSERYKMIPPSSIVYVVPGWLG